MRAHVTQMTATFRSLTRPASNRRSNTGLPYCFRPTISQWLYRALNSFPGGTGSGPASPPWLPRLQRHLLCGLVLLLSLPAWPREDVYQTPEQFLQEAFAGAVPKPQLLWLTDNLRPQIRAILDHDLKQLRLRYWQQERRTAWILEEIGKEKPITVGLVVDDDRIERVKVLIFRESRGWEVRYPFFTDQFVNSRLTTDHRLDRNIDGISGATLSVRALTKLARLALYLHRQTVGVHDATR